MTPRPGMLPLAGSIQPVARLALAAALALFAACDRPAGGPDPVPVAELPVVDAGSLLDLASAGYGAPGGGAAELTDVVDVLELAPDSILVLDAAPPFLHLIDGAGEPLASFGPEGDGPGELRRPWDLAADPVHVWIRDRTGLVGWSREELRETRRIQPAPQASALATGCGRDLLVVTEGPKAGAGTSYDPQYGLAALDAGGDAGPEPAWTTIHPVPPPNMPLQLGWPRFGAVPSGDTAIALVAWWDGEIQVMPCGPEVPERGSTGVGRFPFAGEGEWSGAPVPEGIAATDGTIVAFFGDRRMAVDTTHVAVVDVTTGDVRRFRLEGRFALLEQTPERVWVADLRLEPAVHWIPAEAFFDWASGGAVPWLR